MVGKNNKFFLGFLSFCILLSGIYDSVGAEGITKSDLYKQRSEIYPKNISNHSYGLNKSLSGKKNYKEGEIIVGYKNNTLFSLSQSSFTDKIGYRVKMLGNTKYVISSTQHTTEDLLQQFGQDPSIAFIQPNFIYTSTSLEVNDPLYGDLWGLNNTQQTLNGDITADGSTDIDWPEGMELYTKTSSGTETIVAVIDTGVNYLHSDLSSQMWDGSNCVDEKGDFLGGCISGYNYYNNTNNPLDTYGHGTHVAGIVGAESQNNQGVVGVNPHVKIMAVQGLGDFGGTSEDLAKAIYFAEKNGAKIINASWGGYDLYYQDCSVGSTPYLDMVLYNAIKDFRDAGGLFIAAAGNDSMNHDNVTDKMFPAAFGKDLVCGDIALEGLDNIISVASVDSQGDLSYFSDYGMNTVDIAAPGSDILSTFIDLIDISKVHFFQTGAEFIYDTTSSVLPSYLTGAIGRWGIYDTLNPGSYYDIYPDERNPYGTGSVYTVSSIDYDLLSYQQQDGVYEMSFISECSLPLENNGEDYLSIEFSSDGGQTYTEVKRFDMPGYELQYNNLQIPENYITSNFRFQLKWVSGADENVSVGCNITPYIDIVGYTKDKNLYMWESGTSMATPYVSGLASLILSVNPNLTYSEVKNIILQSGKSLLSLQGKTVTGKMINAYNAIVSLQSFSQLENISLFNGDTLVSSGTGGVSTSYKFKLDWEDKGETFQYTPLYNIEIRDEDGNLIDSIDVMNTEYNFSIFKSGKYSFSVSKKKPDGSRTSGVTLPLMDIIVPDKKIVEVPLYTTQTNIILHSTQLEGYTCSFSGDIKPFTNGINDTFLFQDDTTLSLQLLPGDGRKDIILSCNAGTPQEYVFHENTILDTHAPDLRIVQTGGSLYNTGTMFLSGEILDENADSISMTGYVLNKGITQLLDFSSLVKTPTNSGFTFTLPVTLLGGKNDVFLQVEDGAGFKKSFTGVFVRQGNAPRVSVLQKFDTLEFEIEKDFEGTGILLYGTGNNLLVYTGGIQKNERIILPVSGGMQYFYQVYYQNDGIDSQKTSLSSFITTAFMPSNIAGGYVFTGPLALPNADNNGIHFPVNSALQLYDVNNPYNKVVFPYLAFDITSKNGQWDGILYPPTEVQSTGSLSLSGYTRLNITVQAGSKTDSLTLVGGTAELQVAFGNMYDGKQLQIYRSEDNQNTFHVLGSCVVTNGICKFSTNKFSEFAFLISNTPSSSTSSSSSGGGGGGGGSMVVVKTSATGSTVSSPKNISAKFCFVDEVDTACKLYYGYETYKGYKYVVLLDDTGKKIEKVMQKIIDISQISQEHKTQFVTTFNTFLIAKYTYMYKKTLVLGTQYTQQKEKLIGVIHTLQTDIVDAKQSSKVSITTDKKLTVPPQQKSLDVYMVKSYSVKLYKEKSFQTLTAWLKQGDEVEIIQDEGSVVQIRIVKSYLPRYVGKTGYIYKTHLQKK